MKNKIKQIWNAVTTLLLVMFVFLAILLWGVQLLDIEVFMVQSGSMEPAYHTGSLVYVQKIEPSELEIGDVITFELRGGMKATHRIVEIVSDENAPGILFFRTKGDANDIADSSLVSASQIVGKVLFSIPYLGFVVNYIQQPPGMYIAAAVTAAVLLLMILPELIFDEKDNKKKMRNNRRTGH